MTSKYALVIANTEYQDASFAKLSAPGKDAEEFAQVLGDAELAAFDDVDVLLNEGESKIRRSIARFFVNRQRDDLLLLYFSGHGVRNDQGQLFLATNDTEISILDATGIPADFVTHVMNNSRSQRQLLILDCCNSGAFAHGSKSASALGKSMGIATAFEGSGFGRVVLTATDATQYAWEGDKVIGDTQKSVFTHFLIEGLKGEADRDGDGRIHVDELYDYAYEQVVRRTPKQTPGKWSYKQQGDLVLRENLRPRNVKPAPLPAELLEMLSHSNSGVRRAGIQELISLLDGKHLGLARAAQEKLREIAENDDSLTLRRSANETLMAHGFLFEQPEPVAIPKVEPQKEEKVEKPVVKQMPLTPSPTPAIQEKIAQKKVVPNFNFRLVGGIAGGLLLISLLVWGGLKLLQNLPAATSEPTRTAQSSTTTTSQPEHTNTPSSIQTSTSPVPILGIGSTMISEKDGMTLLYVPAGEFTMGSDNGASNEKPVHKVTLDAFWIDKTEVTVRMYSLCVQAGVCNEPISKESDTHSSYYGNAEFDNYPVIYVDWNMAKTYCEWVERRLPTEAEWEKAARGTDARTYPWGNDAPNNNLLNYISAVGDTTEVGKYSDGTSPYGVLDMAGNVWEWVADWYDVYPGGDANADSYFGQKSRVLRGGSWDSSGTDARSAIRYGYFPAFAYNYIGFRCAVSEAAQAGSTPLPEAGLTQTSELGIGSTMIGKDGMTLLFVPAGEFTMGSDSNSDEQPIHKVTLDAFWIDQTEVTNKMYSSCVEAGVCEEPTNASSYSHSSYYGNAEFYDYPVIYVDWNMAKTYCEWADRRLPTEAEWEKAARGENANVYPWGNTFDGSLVNFCDTNCSFSYADKSSDDGFADVAPVGSYPNGASVYGALDMAGNVREWVNDWYSETYDSSSPSSNPEGPSSGQYRVLRGGSWISGDDVVRSSVRYGNGSTDSDDDIGFRCAMSAAP